MSDEDQLNSAERELETALRSLRPTPARINPTAAAYSAGLRKGPARLRFWQAAAAAAVAAAAGGAWLTLGPRGEAPNQIAIHAPVVEPSFGAAGRLPIEPPTWLAYRQALTRSVDELDALLDRQSTSGTPAEAQATPVGVLTLWSADIHASLGEM